MLTAAEALARWNAGQHPRYRVIKNCDMDQPFAMLEEWADGSQTACDVFQFTDTNRQRLEDEAARLNAHMIECDARQSIAA